MSAKESIKHFFVFMCLTISLTGCGGNAAPETPAVITVIVPVEVTAVPTVEPAELTKAPADTWKVIDSGRIQFEPNTTGWHTQGDLPAGAALKFTLNAARGQQLNIRLNYRYGQMEDNSAALYITGADGMVFTPNPVTYFSQILPADQDYNIEIRSLAPQDTSYAISIDIPPTKIDPALGDKYEPVDPSICQIIQDSAAQALGIEFYREDRAPFMDTIAGEAGQGCRVYAVTDGTKIADPWTVLTTLMNSAGGGWTEQNGYQAAGPTGFATAMTRDMGLMMMDVGWKPAMGVDCPDDQPISACPLTPEQKTYSINIDVAQYRSNLSVDGHWEDAANYFSLDLHQDWKNVWGKHTVVAQDGTRIDSLDVSISGLMEGQVVNLLFKSSFTQSEGRAQISFIDINTIQWKIITPPDGEYYLPGEATLIRK
jgi:hypothetical protein